VIDVKKPRLSDESAQMNKYTCGRRRAGGVVVAPDRRRGGAVVRVPVVRRRRVGRVETHGRRLALREVHPGGQPDRLDLFHAVGHGPGRSSTVYRRRFRRGDPHFDAVVARHAARVLRALPLLPFQYALRLVRRRRHVADEPSAARPGVVRRSRHAIRFPVDGSRNLVVVVVVVVSSPLLLLLLLLHVVAEPVHRQPAIAFLRRTAVPETYERVQIVSSGRDQRFSLPFFRSVRLTGRRFVVHVDNVYLARGRVEVHFGPAKLHFLVGVLFVRAVFLVRHFAHHRDRMPFRRIVFIEFFARRRGHTDGQPSRVYLYENNAL